MILCKLGWFPMCACRNALRNDIKTSLNLIVPKQIESWSIRRWYSENVSINSDLTQEAITEIKSKFPEPRVTLQNTSARLPDKMFDIHYKSSSLKSKKNVMNWTCTYDFVWPEKIRFECTGTSKRQAAEKAAAQALIWLVKNKKIDSKGYPVYDKEIIREIKSQLNDRITVSTSNEFIEKIDELWIEYQNGIKQKFDETRQSILNSYEVPAVLTRDSTLDTENDLIMDTNSTLSSCDSELNRRIHPVYGRQVAPPTTQQIERRQKVLDLKFQKYKTDVVPLPIDEYIHEITTAVKNNRVVVLVGAPGCGKSTRAPAAILRAFGATSTVLVSEPRRVAAIGLAESVADELDEEIGDTIGYQVRLRSVLPKPPTGSILHCTSGILLRRLQANPGLFGCTHLVIDEAHERDVNTDLTLLLVKKALELNPTLKVIIMSATLNVDVFARYFDKCPIVEVPGKAYPVECFYLDDIKNKYKLDLSYTKNSQEGEDPCVSCSEIVHVIKAIDKNENEGAILVFLPGWAEIKYCIQLLQDEFVDSGRHVVMPIHSKLTAQDQAKIFSKPTPGVRKIVLATNIAETSITIRDVVYVVDCGTHKENRVKYGNVSLSAVWISKASAKQRMGRAGRIQPGKCYKMYAKEKESEFTDFATAEILRVPLEQIVLDCKTYAPDDKVEDFLAQLPEPPKQSAIYRAVDDLIDLGALTPSEKLTPLGQKLTHFTLQPRLAVAIINSFVLNNVLAINSIATILSGNTHTFDGSCSNEDIREKKLKYSTTSDFVALNTIQDKFEALCENRQTDEINLFIESNGVRKEALYGVKALSNLHLEQLIKCLALEQSDDLTKLNSLSNSEHMLTAAMLSATNHLLVTLRQLKVKGKLGTKRNIFTSTNQKVHIHGQSVNSLLTKDSSSKASLLTYYGGLVSNERRALVVHNTAMVTPLMALLFCDGSLKIQENVEINGEEFSVLSLPRHNLDVAVPKRQCQQIVNAKEMLWDTILYYHNSSGCLSEDNRSVQEFKTKLINILAKSLESK